ncbi:MAG: metal ABC transporter permease [Acidimicrobiia bacterium]|nr:metal ABC transporter permease [Acidimicrobiia bacterium]MDH4365941.1 metal ABC transporter permease [Acidimicrobiia bacterium]
MLHYAFMQRALLAALLVGLTAPVVGVYLVQRRLALIGDGLGHVALTGVALGVLTGGAPVLVALACSVAGAVAIEVIRARGKASADVALAVMFYGGIAGGVVLIGLSPQGTPANLSAYLFGAITTTTADDLAIFALLSAGVLAVAVGLAPRLFAVSNDEEFARASGMNVLGLNVLLAVLTAATVVISMRIVGLLLISALMIVPNAVAQVTAGSFRSSMAVAVGVGVGASVAGTGLSYYADTPSGGTIVLLAIAVFLVASVASWLRSRWHGRRHHDTREHPHEHGPGCGHEAIPHGDHVDYLHDGHRHAAHGAHYDEH